MGNVYLARPSVRPRENTCANYVKKATPKMNGNHSYRNAMRIIWHLSQMRIAILTTMITTRPARTPNGTMVST